PEMANARKEENCRMEAHATQLAPLRASEAFCTFAVHEIRALASRDDSFGREYAWYEALIRPRGAYRHWSPGDFVDRLYRERPAVDTDLEVLRRVSTWLVAQEKPTRVSINTHPESLTRSAFVEGVIESRHRAFQAGHSICLELIEFGSSQHKEALIANAQRLRHAGVLIALDDFGSRVNCFDLCAAGIVDLLKIDVSVTSGVHVDSNHRAIVESIKTLGQGLDARVIAEGV